MAAFVLLSGVFCSRFCILLVTWRVASLVPLAPAPNFSPVSLNLPVFVAKPQSFTQLVRTLNLFLFFTLLLIPICIERNRSRQCPATDRDRVCLASARRSALPSRALFFAMCRVSMANVYVYCLSVCVVPCCYLCLFLCFSLLSLSACLHQFVFCCCFTKKDGTINGKMLFFFFTFLNFDCVHSFWWARLQALILCALHHKTIGIYFLFFSLSCTLCTFVFLAHCDETNDNLAFFWSWPVLH